MVGDLKVEYFVKVQNKNISKFISDPIVKKKYIFNSIVNECANVHAIYS